MSIPKEDTEDTRSADHGALREQYREESNVVFLENCRRGAVFAMIFSLAGYILDYFIYGGGGNDELLRRIIFLRVSAATVLLVLLLLLHVLTAPHIVRVLAHVVAFVPMVALDLVLLEIGEGDSHYYAGLNLIMVATVLLLRWSLKDAIINAMLCIGGYLGVAVALQTSAGDIVTVTFFLLATGTFACVGAYFLDRLRFEDFCSKQDLEVALGELKDNEARLLQAEKLSSLGTMSAGIVHEVNNPLNYAVTALHALKMYEDDLPESEREDYLDTVNDAEEGVGRVINIISDLRGFTKGETGLKEEVIIADVVESARRLVSRDLAELDFVVGIAPGLKVLGNSSQLTQVCINLIQNSALALGDIDRSTRRPEIKIKGYHDDEGNIVLSVRDNGLGIPESDLEKIFDPFFTKRDVGEGMGMGLSICHRILEAHNAWVEAMSELGAYTEIIMTFPPLPMSWSRPPEEDQAKKREFVGEKN